MPGVWRAPAELCEFFFFFLVGGLGEAGGGARRPRRRRAFGGHVAPGVFGQVVAAHEPAVAHGAGELLLPRVRAAVARQFVRARELLVAAFPRAAERLLPCVRPQVGLEVRALEVGFLAAGEGAHVVAPPRELHRRRYRGDAGPGAGSRGDVHRRRSQREELRDHRASPRAHLKTAERRGKTGTKPGLE